MKKKGKKEKNKGSEGISNGWEHESVGHKVLELF
jgi:hypothetical protein